MQNLKEFASKEKTVSQEEMHAIELNSYSIGISPIQLMENAGNAVASFIMENFRPKNVLVFCGTGSNGGDGLVAARLLSKYCNVSIILMGKQIKGDAALSNFYAVSSLRSVKLQYYEDLDKEKIMEEIKKSDIVVDAIFGTGFKGELSGIFKEAVNLINSYANRVIAVDMPSGFSKESKLYVNASYTITFHKLKEGMEKLDNVIVKDIGIPIEAELIAGPGDVYKALKPISEFVSKRERGTLIIIGGSKVYHSGPTHSLLSASALGSLRVGAGYVYLYVPHSILNPVRSISSNQIVKPLGSNYISFSEELKKEIERAQAVAIGMGITKEKPAQQACLKIVKYALSKGKKIIVDADGISAISNIKGNKNILVTPHDKEFYRFSGTKLEHESEGNIYERIKVAMKVAREKEVIVLLKGHNTIITDGKNVKINMAKASNLSTMGSGDVLSGIIGGFAAMGSSLFDAAVAGAYLHSKAGEVLKIEKGNHIIASDIIDVLPKLLVEFDKV